MVSSVIETTRAAAWRTLSAGALVLVGLVVGVSCVILPRGVPLGVVGLAGLVLLWTLPDLKVVPARACRWLIYPLVASSISVPTYFALILPGLHWISIRRSILFAFVASIATIISASSYYRSEVYRIGRQTPFLFFCTAGYFLLLVASVLVSSRPGNSISFVINTTMIWWLPLVAVMILIKTKTEIERLMAVAIICMNIDMIMGLIETRLQRPFLIFLMPASMRAQMVEALPTYASLFSGGSRSGAYRAVSTYVTPLSWGEMAAMMGPIAAHFLAFGKSGLIRILGLISLASCLYSIYLSGSRGAYVGFMASIIVYMVIWSVRHMRAKPGSLVGGTTFVLYSIFSVGVVLSVVFVGKVHRLVLGGGELQSSNDGRSLEWAMALPKFYRSPIWGYGTGTAIDVVGYATMGGTPTLDSHLINVMIDTGALGLILFAGMFLGGIVVCIRNYIFDLSAESTVCGAIGCSLVSYSIYRTTLSQTENTTISFVLIGLAFVANSSLRDKKNWNVA